MKKKKRGFAGMDKKKQREMAAMGGRAPYKSPKGFAALPIEVRKAIASKGGKALHSK